MPDQPDMDHEPAGIPVMAANAELWETICEALALAGSAAPGSHTWYAGLRVAALLAKTYRDAAAIHPRPGDDESLRRLSYRIRRQIAHSPDPVSLAAAVRAAESAIGWMASDVRWLEINDLRAAGEEALGKSGQALPQTAPHDPLPGSPAPARSGESEDLPSRPHP